MKYGKEFFKSIFKNYCAHDCFHLAANISFFAILSLIPVTMLMVSAAGLMLETSEELFLQITQTITTGLPDAISAGFIVNLKNVMQGSSSLGWLGFAFLLFISTFIFSSLEHSLDKVFQSTHKRNFFHSKFLAVFLIFLVMFLFSLPTTISLFERLVGNLGYHIPLSSYMTAKVFFFIFTFLSFILAITIVPNQRVYIGHAFVGAFIFAGGVVLAKHIFGWYLVMSFDRYNVVYGSLTALVLLFIWIYYVASILLLSSEVVAAIQREREK